MTTPDPTRAQPRALWIADEIGASNVEIVADAYWHGYAHALDAARSALAGTAPTVPRPTRATLHWLGETTHRPRYRDIVSGGETDGPMSPEQHRAQGLANLQGSEFHRGQR